MIEKNSSEEEILQVEETETDKRLDLTLRPTKMADYIGQTKAKENLDILVQAAKKGKSLLNIY